MENTPPKSFDKILKENLEELFLPISEKWLGFKIIKSEPLPEKLQVTLEREPDFIRIVETEKQERFILHLEFQSTNDTEMVYRQAEYKAILQRKYKIPVRQFVIYLGSQRLTMKTQLPENQRITGFELRNIQEYRYEQLIFSNIPQEIILAILGDFHGIDPEKVIRQILERLQQISKGELELQKYVRQLNMLSKLRKLGEQTIKITENMPITFDIETDYAYQQGVEHEKKRFITELLQVGNFTVKQIAKISEVSEEFVLQIKKEVDQERIDFDKDSKEL